MTTSTRVLRLLALLQTRRDWSGLELSERLEVDVRTIRRDANRLRELGYVIESATGAGGGYRLGAGTHTPPLLLEDEEALTVAIALSVVTGSVANLSDIALRVLVKLDQLLPARLRRKWAALKAVTVSLANRHEAADASALTRLAVACRDHRSVAFRYADRSKQSSQRDVEPMRLAHTGQIWYLVAWDKQRRDWRTFRVDRIDAKAGIALGERFVPREPPEDFAAYISRSIAASPYRYQARLKLDLPLVKARECIPTWVGLLEPLDDRDDRHCVLTIGANSHEALTALIVNAGVEFELLEPAELRNAIQSVSQRLARGVNVALPKPKASRSA